MHMMCRFAPSMMDIVCRRRITIQKKSWCQALSSKPSLIVGCRRCLGGRHLIPLASHEGTRFHWLMLRRPALTAEWPCGTLCYQLSKPVMRKVHANSCTNMAYITPMHVVCTRRSLQRACQAQYSYSTRTSPHQLVVALLRQDRRQLERRDQVRTCSQLHLRFSDHLPMVLAGCLSRPRSSRHVSALHRHLWIRTLVGSVRCALFYSSLRFSWTFIPRTSRLPRCSLTPCLLTTSPSSFFPPSSRFLHH